MISDELRDWLSISRCSSGLLVSNSECDRLLALADRIDSEMVELPKDKDGEPIHVGDAVWMADKGALELTVRSITLHACGAVNVDASCEGCHAHVSPEDLTHTRPDSLERIADELEAWCDGADVDGDAGEKPRDLAMRIRRLAQVRAHGAQVVR